MCGCHKKDVSPLLKKNWSDLTHEEQNQFKPSGIFNSFGIFQSMKEQQERERRREMSFFTSRNLGNR